MSIHTWRVPYPTYSIWEHMCAYTLTHTHTYACNIQIHTTQIAAVISLGGRTHRYLRDFSVFRENVRASPSLRKGKGVERWVRSRWTCTRTRKHNTKPVWDPKQAWDSRADDIKVLRRKQPPINKGGWDPFTCKHGNKMTIRLSGKGMK